MLNRIDIMGRITREIELKKVNDVSCVNFTVACDRDYTGADGTRETDFIDCNAWRGTADFINKYFSKGSQIVLSGRLQSRKYTDNDGKNRNAWFVNVENVYFVGSNNSGSKKTESGFNEMPGADEEIPF